MTTLTFCILDNGRLPEGIRETLARIFPSFAGKKMRLVIEEAKDKRSLGQNSYYRGFILPHVRQVRFKNGDPVSLDNAHEDLLEEFAPRVTGVTLLGKKYGRAKRTHEMNVTEMAEFITAITARMAQFNDPVPMQEEL